MEYLEWSILNGVYRDVPAVRATYNLLCTLGYKMSDDKTKLLDGTHELYKIVKSACRINTKHRNSDEGATQRPQF